MAGRIVGGHAYDFVQLMAGRTPLDMAILGMDAAVIKHKYMYVYVRIYTYIYIYTNIYVYMRDTIVIYMCIGIDSRTS